MLSTRIDQTDMDNLPASLYLGIDTGGTFTDGVLLDPQTRQVVRSRKVLTTHHDLKICISQILDDLIPGVPAAIKLVSLSTTLATNAIAEGKRRPVALMLLGYDPDLVAKFNFHRQFGTPRYFFIGGRHNLDGVEEIPLDEAGLARAANQWKTEVDAFAIASYAGPANAQHEERSAEIVSGLTSLPVIQAHHLSSELDSIRRATTASLNASLLANVQEFITAVEEMLVQKGVRCPVMMMRGDASIVRAGYARKRPVEIIHSGPATSALGGQFLAGAKAALVVDMGGTTTDLIVVDRGEIKALQNAATIGQYRTCVRTVHARSFGLGGDSQISFDLNRTLKIGPERVLPLAHLCHDYPEVRAELAGWLNSKGQLRYSDEIEYWIFRREPNHPIANPQTRKALELLRSGPQRMRQLVKEVGAKSPVLIDQEELISQGIIERAGLTPTDLMHVTGDFTPWNAEIAGLAAAAAASIWGESALAFARRVRAEMTRRIAGEIIQYLSHKSLSDEALSFRSHDLDRWLFEENLSGGDPYLGCKLFLKVPMIGIGAPARVFLPDVARALGTEFILPQYYEVANAIGAVVGNVIIRKTASVFPRTEGSSVTGYFARVADRQECFDDYPQAMEFAREALEGQIASEVREAGANPETVEYEVSEFAPGMAHLEARSICLPKPGGPG